MFIITYKKLLYIYIKMIVFIFLYIKKIYIHAFVYKYAALFEFGLVNYTIP